MIRIYCDVCNKDLHDEKAPWTVQSTEYKSGQNTLTLHLCEDHHHLLLVAVERMVKDQAKKNGEA